MNSWKYYRGEWTEIEDPLEWKDGEEWETFLKRAGYYSFPQQTWGDSAVSAGVDLYVKEDYKSPYLITFNFSAYIEHVYIDDIPSLMQWLRDYTPLFSLQQIAETQDELQTLFERAFRAWHGHSYMDVCPRCDPLEVEKRQQFRQRRMERQKTKQRSEAER